MSAIRSHISTHERFQAGRGNVLRTVRSLWADAAERHLEARIFDELEAFDKKYASDLIELNSEFDKASKLLG
jgi:hypothetical protein